MIKGKRLAQSFREKKRVIIKKEKEYFWVTNIYILIRLSLKEGKQFFKKWNSYKSTKNLPELNEGEVYEIGPKKEGFIKEHDPISPFIGGAYPNMKEVEITDITYISSDKLFRVYLFGKKDKKKQGIFDHKYSFFIDKMDYEKALVQKVNKPIIFKDKKNRFKGLLMPIKSKQKDYLKEIKKIAG